MNGSPAEQTDQAGSQWCRRPQGVPRLRCRRGVHALIHCTIVCYAGVYPPRAVDFFKRFHSLEAIGNRALADVIVVVEANKHIEQTRTPL